MAILSRETERVRSQYMATSSRCVLDASRTFRLRTDGEQDENFQDKHTTPGLLSMVRPTMARSMAIDSYTPLGKLRTKHEWLPGTSEHCPFASCY